MRRLSALFLVALTVAATPRTAAQAPVTRPGTNHVVFISLDGFMSSALDDPFLPLPTLRRLAANGVVAKAMRPVNPTVTWANHTAMVTGMTPSGHGVIFNGLLIRKPGVPPVVEPWRDKSEMVRARTLYDVAHAAGLTTAQVDWVAIWNAPTITWEFRERPDVAQTIPQEMIKAGLVSDDDVGVVRHAQHRLARRGLDHGRRPHHSTASAEPHAVPPAQPGLDAASLRTTHAGGNDNDGAPGRTGGTHRGRGRGRGPHAADDVLRGVRPRVQDGEAAYPAEYGLRASRLADGDGWEGDERGRLLGARGRHRACLRDGPGSGRRGARADEGRACGHRRYREGRGAGRVRRARAPVAAGERPDGCALSDCP